LNVIYYASKTLDAAKNNYATTEKEFLAVVFACDKFRPYIVDSEGFRNVVNQKNSYRCEQESQDLI
jgi:hypothetical protein